MQEIEDYVNEGKSSGNVLRIKILKMINESGTSEKVLEKLIEFTAGLKANDRSIEIANILRQGLYLIGPNSDSNLRFIL